MTLDIAEKLLEWEQDRDDPLLDGAAVRLVRFLELKLYDDYEPCPFDHFNGRFLKWLGNVSDEADQKTLLSMLAQTFYVGRREYEALYRDLYRNHLSRWISEKYQVQFDDPNFDETIKHLLAHAWICPLTDSLRINGFLKVNAISGREHRPDWHSLREFGSKKRITDYVADNFIQDVILIEDFVGSGVQSAKTVSFAARILPQCRIVVSPLVVCPRGHKRFQQIAARYKNVTYLPSLVLPASGFMSKKSKRDEPHCFEAARQLFGRVYLDLGYSSVDHLYGFKDTGGLVVLYSNCPDNTLPIFHAESDKWSPLFPRVWRG